jgi:hypothetical protein
VHYRVYKLETPSGGIVKGKDIEADDDRQALQEAAQDEDCPICEVWQGTNKIGTIDEDDG